MKITNKGVVFNEYKTANPGTGYSSFTDGDGATLMIKTSTLIAMAELAEWDLKRRGGWGVVSAESWDTYGNPLNNIG